MGGSTGGSASSTATSGLTFGGGNTYDIDASSGPVPSSSIASSTSGYPAWLLPVLAVVVVIVGLFFVTRK